MGLDKQKIISATLAYHLGELEIARSPDDPSHVLPRITPEDRRIIDVGCGIGQSLIASELDPGVTAVGADVDALSLQYGSRQFGGIRFVQAAAERLPFRDGTFDLFIARVSFPYTNLPLAAREAARVLRPGGRIWLVLHPLRKVWRNLWRSVRQFRLRSTVFNVYVLLNGAAFHCLSLVFAFPGNRRYESFQTGRGIRRTLEASGFADVAMERGGHFVATARRRCVSRPCPP